VDTWEVNDSVTLSAGIRNEKFENFNGVGDLFFEIEDQWAPRLALVWAPGESTEQRVSVNWGRYHLPMMSYPVIGYGNAYSDVLRYFVYDGNRDARTAAPIAIDGNGVPMTQELGIAFIQGDGSVGDTRSVLDSSLKPMYQDEWIIAYEREFGADWVAGIRYVNRELKSLIEDVTTDAGLVAIDFDGPIGVFAGQDCSTVMANPGTDITTFCEDSEGVLQKTFIPASALGYPKPKREYEAVEFTVRKSFSNGWALQGSYTWSKNEGNTEGSVKSDNGQGGANLTTDFDFPELMDGANGYLPNDRRHKLKVWGSYEATDRLTFGANLFDSDGVTEVYENAEERPDQFKLPTQYQQPRYLRFGAAVRI
jgi:hypothetical protein